MTISSHSGHGLVQVEKVLSSNVCSHCPSPYPEWPLYLVYYSSPYSILYVGGINRYSPSLVYVRNHNFIKSPLCQTWHINDHAGGAGTKRSVLYNLAKWKGHPTLIARFMGPTRGSSGADRTQVGPMLAPWTLLSRNIHRECGRLCDVSSFKQTGQQQSGAT